MSAANDDKGAIQVDDREIKKLNVVHEHATKDKAMDLGKIGVWLGSRENAATYLAAATIFFAGAAAVALSVSDPSLRPDTVKALLSLTILAAGYMFGKGTGGHG
jgi:hypothetical protein